MSPLSSHGPPAQVRPGYLMWAGELQSSVPGFVSGLNMYLPECSSSGSLTCAPVACPILQRSSLSDLTYPILGPQKYLQAPPQPSNSGLNLECSFEFSHPTGQIRRPETCDLALCLLRASIKRLSLTPPGGRGAPTATYPQSTDLSFPAYQVPF